MKRLSLFIGLLLCTGIAFAVDVQTALKETAEQFSTSLKPKSVVAIIGIHSESPVLSDFMLDELTVHFVRLKKLTIADRANLEAIKKEMSFQLSGEVGDESIQQLGAKIGAETVIQGTLKQLGKSARYTLTIRALDVTTAAVTDMYRANVELNEIEAEMLGVKAVKKAPTQYSVASVWFQNLLFGLGSYRTGHPVDGAVLTVGHLVGWSFFLGGIGGLVTSDPRESAAVEVGFMLSGGIIELGSIIYGFIAPAVHLKRARANAIAANDTGFKFNLAYTSSGDIAPQLSYKIRY